MRKILTKKNIITLILTIALYAVLFGLVEAVYMPEAFCVGGAVVSGVFLPHRCEQPEDLLRICCSGLCIKGLTKYRSIMVWPEFPTSDIQPLLERLAGCLSKAWV